MPELPLGIGRGPDRDDSDSTLTSATIHDWRPVYSGPGKSGVCVCGHLAEEHHRCAVMNLEYLEATGEEWVLCECEFYDCNEGGGLDEHGQPHCGRYQDRGVDVDATRDAILDS